MNMIYDADNGRERLNSFDSLNDNINIFRSKNTGHEEDFHDSNSASVHSNHDITENNKNNKLKNHRNKNNNHKNPDLNQPSNPQ